MTLAEFRRTLSEPKPPVGLVPALAALWWAGKNDWHKAHEIVMDDEGRDCAWVHAYLHRVEGDLPNSRYWYDEAGRHAASSSLQTEWDDIVSALVGKVDYLS